MLCLRQSFGKREKNFAAMRRRNQFVQVLSVSEERKREALLSPVIPGHAKREL
jgi:hypothetical protein